MTYDWTSERQAERTPADEKKARARHPRPAEKAVILMAKRVRVLVDLDDAGWAQLKLRVHQLVAEVTDDVYFTARSLVPVDTGELMGTLRVTYPAWNRGRVWVGSDHWSYNEYGTSKMDAQPFMRPALYRARTPNGA